MCVHIYTSEREEEREEKEIISDHEGHAFTESTQACNGWYHKTAENYYHGEAIHRSESTLAMTMTIASTEKHLKKKKKKESPYLLKITV